MSCQPLATSLFITIQMDLVEMAMQDGTTVAEFKTLAPKITLKISSARLLDLIKNCLAQLCLLRHLRGLILLTPTFICLRDKQILKTKPISVKCVSQIVYLVQKSLLFLLIQLTLQNHIAVITLSIQINKTEACNS